MSPTTLAQVLGGIRKFDDPNLLVGFSGADDAAVYRLSDDTAIVVTTDFFPPIVDDPYMYGAIAAANALSDVYAMGGRPLVALNLVCFPSKKLPLEMLQRILEGGADTVRKAGAVIGGGHTIEDDEPKYGLAVTGTVHPDRIWKNGGVRLGDALILTKPLGTGLVASAIKKRNDQSSVTREAMRWMATLNGTGIDHLHAASVSSATDITGFGLVGHGRELAEGSPGALTIRCRDLPRLNGIEAYFDDQLVTGGSRRNRSFVGEALSVGSGVAPWDLELCLDPQTSGGLLVSLPAEKAEAVVQALRRAGLSHAAVIGEVTPFDGRHRVNLI